MSHTTRWILLLSFTVGLGAGIYIGWVLNPVKYVDTAPDSLHQSYKDDYVILIATVYAGEGDLTAARADLVELGLGDNLAAAVTAIAARQRAANGAPDDIRHLDHLAAALLTMP